MTSKRRLRRLWRALEVDVLNGWLVIHSLRSVLQSGQNQIVSKTLRPYHLHKEQYISMLRESHPGSFLIKAFALDSEMPMSSYMSCCSSEHHKKC